MLRSSLIVAASAAFTSLCTAKHQHKHVHHEPSASIYLLNPASSSASVSSSVAQLSAPDSNAILSSFLGVHSDEYLRDGLEVPEQAIFAIDHAAHQASVPPLLILADKFRKSEDGGLSHYVSPATLEGLNVAALNVTKSPKSEAWQLLLSSYAQKLQEKYEVAAPVNTDAGASSDPAKRWLVPGSLDGVTALGDIAGQDEVYQAYMSTLTSLAKYEADGTLPTSGYLHLTGLRAIANKYGSDSTEFTQACEMLRLTVDSLLLTHAEQHGQRAALFLVPSPPPHFRDHKHKDGKHSLDKGAGKVRRSAPVSLDAFSTVPRHVAAFQKRQEGNRPLPLVPSSGQCFVSADACTNATSSCMGHGQCVQAIKAGNVNNGNNEGCFICQCQVTKDETSGRQRYWSGTACQKEDVSSQFFIIAGATLMLFFIGAVSVSLLAKIGSEELPSTLAAMGGGAGGHHKRD